MFVVYPLLEAIVERVPFRLFVLTPALLLFSFTWLPAIVFGLVNVRKRVWIHTTHG